ncbi:MAG: polyprenyl synthetase family protein [Clostridia bacterium]|nr:polyprenyl synthetase family protein [Clostridia bacterium]
MTIEEYIIATAEKVDQPLKDGLAVTDAALETLYDSMRYSALSPGKRIRPFLVLEFCRMFGGNDAAAMDFACAIEYIHSSSLVHDDMPCMDNDDYRRGRLTNHKVYGEDIALLCGDALMTRGYEMASLNDKVPPEAALAATRVLLREVGAFGMMGGQCIDLMAERERPTFDQLLKMHDKKTGALMRASALMGCIAAGKMPGSDECKNAAEYATKIGLAFQILDDILDVTGDVATLGKMTHTDAAEGKTTFLSFMDIDGARKYASDLTDEAVGAIAGYKNNEILTELARFLLCRTK